MALNQTAKDVYESVNTALEDSVGWFSQFVKPKPKNLDDYRASTGLGIPQFPKGSGVQVNGRMPVPQTPGMGRSLDRQNTAIKFDNATRNLVIPRNKDYAGVSPDAIGVAPSGQIILSSLQDERVAFGTHNNSSGWSSAVASFRNIDSGDFTSNRKEQSVSAPVGSAPEGEMR
jgi:hypothetical protein